MASGRQSRRFLAGDGDFSLTQQLTHELEHREFQLAAHLAKQEPSQRAKVQVGNMQEAEVGEKSTA